MDPRLAPSRHLWWRKALCRAPSSGLRLFRRRGPLQFVSSSVKKVTQPTSLRSTGAASAKWTSRQARLPKQCLLQLQSRPLCSFSVPVWLVSAHSFAAVSRSLDLPRCLRHGRLTTARGPPAPLPTLSVVFAGKRFRDDLVLIFVNDVAHALCGYHSNVNAMTFQNHRQQPNVRDMFVRVILEP